MGGTGTGQHALYEGVKACGGWGRHDKGVYSSAFQGVGCCRGTQRILYPTGGVSPKRARNTSLEKMAIIQSLIGGHQGLLSRDAT